MSRRREDAAQRVGRIAGRGLDGVLAFFAVLAGLLLAVGIGMVLLEVAARYFFGVSYPWVFEINENMLVYLPFLAAGWVLRKGGHVTVDLVEVVLSPRARRWSDVVIAAIGASSSMIVVWFGAVLSWEAYTQGRVSLSVTQIPEIYVLPAIPIGGALLVAEFLRQGIRALAGERPVPDPESRSVFEATLDGK